MASYTVDTVIEAPRDVVFDIFADRERNSDFLPVQTRLKSAGTTERQGVGAVHFLGFGKVGVSEQLTELVPGKRIVYKVVAGLPVKLHSGTIEFSDAPNGTRVLYTMEQIPPIPVPSKVIELALRGLIGAFVSGARKEAARRTK
ncbi:SRPBCC family protein [Antrihabitans sp. YC2-6]|uniref:SRPBCC family protein n=1 Tax=Antrihabitans sp. YC2-6 TaxID=2799498 RepID=UPI0018F6B287|nr:SRPBCC family protein [Antrihabitans sp. YC2-6]MBJ8348223.1 SRPBCC family protein [Antrihabitans sp. YC2-6]